MEGKQGKGIGIGYGKIILFGEHFVVYGEEAIASGLKDIKTVVEIKEGPWNAELDENAVEALLKIAKALGIEKSFTLEIKETVPIKSNLGSSAALCTAFARALVDKYKIDISPQKLNKVIYEGEKVFHGTPSGIDNSASLFGKPILFSLDKEKFTFKIESIEIARPLHILVIDTGKKLKPTSESVEQVRRIKQRFDTAEEVFSLYRKLIKRAKKALKEGDVEELGNLFNLNHALLSYFNLTTKNIEEARWLSLSLNALGSKITGGGCGGNIISLFPTKLSALHAQLKLADFGYKSFYSSII